jgi:hypothetical protein
MALLMILKDTPIQLVRTMTIKMHVRNTYKSLCNAVSIRHQIRAGD